MLIFFFLFGFVSHALSVDPWSVLCSDTNLIQLPYANLTEDLVRSRPDQECLDLKTGYPVRAEQRCDYIEDCKNGEDEQLCGYSLLPTRADRFWTTNIDLDYVTRICNDGVSRSFLLTIKKVVTIGKVTSPVFQPTYSRCTARIVFLATDHDTIFSMELEQLLPSGSIRAEILTSHSLNLPPSYLAGFFYVDLDLSNINVPFILRTIADIIDVKPV